MPIIGGGGLVGGDFNLRFDRFALVGFGAWRPTIVLLGDTAFGPGEPFVGGGVVVFFTGKKTSRVHHGVEIRGGYGIDSEAAMVAGAYHLDIYIGRHVAFTAGLGFGWVFNTRDDYAAEQVPEVCGRSKIEIDDCDEPLGCSGISEVECKSLDGPVLYWTLGFRFYMGPVL